MRNSFMKGVREAEAWNKRQMQRRETWISNVMKVYGWDRPTAENEYKKIFQSHP